jgi:hypothetical protein
VRARRSPPVSVPPTSDALPTHQPLS